MENNSSGSIFWGMSEKSYITLMHVSQLGGYIIPFLGYILPVIMWLTNKDNSEKVDSGGKDIINFILSLLIYAVIAIPLYFILIGIPILFALPILQLVCAIVAAVKTSNGENWKYPLTIRLIK